MSDLFCNRDNIPEWMSVDIVVFEQYHEHVCSFI